MIGDYVISIYSLYVYCIIPCCCSAKLLHLLLKQKMLLLLVAVSTLSMSASFTQFLAVRKRHFKYSSAPPVPSPLSQGNQDAYQTNLSFKMLQLLFLIHFCSFQPHLLVLPVVHGLGIAIIGIKSEVMQLLHLLPLLHLLLLLQVYI